MIVLILAAGYATRLYPLTLNTPKPLLKIGKKSILEHILEKVSHVPDVKKCFIVTNQKFFNAFKEVSKFGIKVVNDETTSNENRLGAIRDIEFVIKRYNIQDELLVIGGDNLFEFSLKDFVDFAKVHKTDASLALFDIKNKEKAKQYGVVHIDSSKRVIAFEEKPQRPESTLIATCIYYFPSEKLGLISDYIASGQRVDAPGNYIKWLSENHKVYGFVFKEDWYDIGDIKSLRAADRKYKEKEIKKHDSKKA